MIRKGYTEHRTIHGANHFFGRTAKKNPGNIPYLSAITAHDYKVDVFCS